MDIHLQDLDLHNHNFYNAIKLIRSDIDSILADLDIYDLIVIYGSHITAVSSSSRAYFAGKLAGIGRDAGYWLCSLDNSNRVNFLNYINLYK